MSEHQGMGGSYVVNEAGAKVLVHRTDYVAPETPSAPETEASMPPAARNKKTAAPASQALATDKSLEE
ncbi:MAG: hypothetical protein PHH47_09990 [Gallionella sp.]|nr:hypothetical protein [Gallionella sp.]MDD4947204.1 hypothetical protein [Gallionella sp.]MDD5611878.1 hypothetical protein [Gallionella sp.]